VIIWTLARPEAKNALNQALLVALGAAVANLDDTAGVRAAILTGQGDAFCAGGDLRELRNLETAESILPFVRAGEELCRRIEELPIPVIAAIPGTAFGGGAELAMACDLRVAERRARLSFKQVRMGVTTAWGTIPRVVAAVGEATAARLLLTGDELTAERAHALHLVDEVCDDGRSLEAALSLCDSIVRGAPGAIANMKALLRTARDRPDAVGEEERRRFLSTWSGAEHREAVTAYFERRQPGW
jgi:enoyl-CoA hydratase